MMAQISLSGTLISKAPTLTKKGKSTHSLITGECCEACYMARETVCVCRCGGRYHGAGNPQWNRNQKTLDDGKERGILNE